MFKYLRQKAVKDKAVSLQILHEYLLYRLLGLFSSLWSKTTVAKYGNFYVISGFRREVDEICVLLGYYAAYSGNSLPQVSG
jgi:hypothetical protein